MNERLIGKKLLIETRPDLTLMISSRTKIMCKTANAMQKIAVWELMMKEAVLHTGRTK